jgi:phosphatidylglycerol lysyltransferase
MASIAVASRHLARGARFVVPLALTAGCLWLVRQQVGDDMPAALPASLSGIGAVNILLALGCVAIGFWAVGRYDGLSHRHFGTRVPPRVARLSGTMAIALAQTLGFGVITGALVRHRLLPGLGFRRALQLSVFVSLSFLAAWLWITALACVVLPAPGWTTLPAMVALAGLPLCTGLMAFGPRPRKARWRAALPTLLALGAILLWAALDLLAAALVLYLLIPPGTLGFGSFVPVFLLAYGAGLLSGAPGGVGPFELVLLSLLPQVPDAMLIGAIMGYRGLYYALPAVLGALALLRPLSLDLPPTPVPRARHDGRAELGLMRQNGGRVARLGGSDMALRSGAGRAARCRATGDCCVPHRAAAPRAARQPAGLPVQMHRARGSACPVGGLAGAAHRAGGAAGPAGLRSAPTRLPGPAPQAASGGKGRGPCAAGRGAAAGADGGD